MNKEDMLLLNIVPEGKEAWLSYDQYHELQRLFETLDLPSNVEEEVDSQYFRLYRFLTETANLQIPMNESVLHFNAFTLIRRGYKIEEITATEYQELLRLMEDLEQPDNKDMDLYEFGGHRDLYNYITQHLGLSVEPGRGPVWYRAKDLIEKYESVFQSLQSKTL